METNNKQTNNVDFTFVKLSLMDKLTIGDFFLFSASGPTHIYLGRTSDGRYSYMRTDNNRHCKCKYKRQVYIIDADGDMYIVNGILFYDLQSAMACATCL